jgi:predicted RNase H-like HicB family nuclease
MAREFSVIIERETEGYYVASVPALRGCHRQARSLDELMNRASNFRSQPAAGRFAGRGG